MLSCSLIIPTFKRQNIVLETLNHLNDQKINEAEVIVVDQSPHKFDDLLNFKFKSPNLKFNYVKISKVGLPNARNIGAQSSKSELLIFIDDDCIPNSRLISSYISIFLILTKKFGAWEEELMRIIQQCLSKIIKLLEDILHGMAKLLKILTQTSMVNANGPLEEIFAVLRNKFLKVNGFDTNYIGNAMLEDVDFGFSINKSGGQVRYDPNPTIQHLRIPTGGTRDESADKSMYYRSHNTVYFLRKHHRSFNLFPAFLYLNAVALKDLYKKNILFLLLFGVGRVFLDGFKRKFYCENSIKNR